MKHVVQYSIPKGTPRDEVAYAGMTSVGFVAVVHRSSRKPSAYIKEYIIQDGFLLFVLDIVDIGLLEYWDEGQDELVSQEYEFIDPASCNWSIIN